MEKVGIFFGSSTGNTESAAGMIQAALGNDNADLINVADASAEDITKYNNLIFGSSTWGVGDLQDDFEGFIETLKDVALNNKKVAIFGLGDQDMYCDSFVDAMGEIYETVEGKGCEVVGEVPNEGYDFMCSRALKGEVFIGLPLDEENQSNLSEERIKNWVKQISAKFN